jgi:pilus assembly protein FimV
MDSVPVADQTIREKLDSALARERGFSPTDATAELSLDDLGFDLDKLGASSVSLEALSATDHSDHTATGTDHSSTAATMLANFDAHSQEALEAASRARADELDPTRESTAVISSPLEATRENPMLRGSPMDATHIAEPFIEEPFEDHAATAKGDLDLDLDELARALEGDTVEQPKRDEMRFSTDVFATAIRPGPAGLDMDVGAAGIERIEPTVEQHLTVDSLDLPTLEPVTLSEVGTKLDLARAYMDMGDPDGARSILQEVLTEGSATQKQEAKRLIESLPG